MFYDINIKAKIESDLAKKDLENQLVLALHNIESQYSKLDGVDNNLSVIDYKITEVIELE